MSNENKKIALVTGGNRGIGLETVKQLAEKGFKVLVGVRSEEKGLEVENDLKSKGLDVESIKLDLGDTGTFETAANSIKEKFGKLDVLINNAGISLDEQNNKGFVGASKTSKEVFRKTFETNFFNTIEITQTLIPLIKSSDAGRIVFLSSALGSLTMHSDDNSPIYNMKIPAYDISKTALNGYAVHLAHELKDTNIKVNAAHPGSVVTDMNPNGEITVEEGAKTSVDLATLGEEGYTGKFIYLGNELPW